MFPTFHRCCFCSAVGDTVKAISNFSHLLGDTVLFGLATSNTATIEAGEGTYVVYAYSMEWGQTYCSFLESSKVFYRFFLNRDAKCNVNLIQSFSVLLS